jgi:hypothetical protein
VYVHVEMPSVGLNRSELGLVISTRQDMS